MAGIILINISYEGDNEVSEIYKLHRQTRWVDLEAMVRYCAFKFMISYKVTVTLKLKHIVKDEYFQVS